VKKVSVITVCFNSSKTIKRALDSVNNQTYLNIEHIVIDGNSVDETLKIVNQNKIRPGPVISEADRGIYDAMNKGLVKASGDIICFLNSDDEFHSLNLVADVVEVFENDKLDLVYGDVIYVSKERKPVRHYKSKGFTFDKLRFGFMPAHPSLFVRANIYKLLQGFRADFKIAGDFEICCRIFQIPNLQTCYLERPFVNMQMGGASAVSFSNILLVNREILEACLCNGIKTNFLNLFLRYFRKIYEFKF
jgi:glycosyltransferase involved in cell wall biosynthesis